MRAEIHAPINVAEPMTLTLGSPATKYFLNLHLIANIDAVLKNLCRLVIQVGVAISRWNAEARDRRILIEHAGKIRYMISTCTHDANVCQRIYFKKYIIYSLSNNELLG